MGDQTLLNTASAEFGQVEYYLQWCLGASTAQVSSAYTISNPHLSAQFEHRCKDLLVLNAWVPLSDFKAPNKLDEVIRQGFSFDESPNNNGFKVSVGEIRIQKHEKEGSNEYQYMLCKVGVGRAHICDPKRVHQTNIPSGYDSLLLNHPNLVPATNLSNEKKEKIAKNNAFTNHNSKPEIESYFQEYYIRNPAQLLPLYLVSFSYDPIKEKQSRERPQCDNCETALATVFCAADNANLCAKCDTTAHASKLSSRHIRTPIGQGADVFGFCRHHKDKLVEFFCPECHIPVCVHCKMVGNHASGDAAKHQLVSVSESYQTVLMDSQRADPVIQQRQSRIASQIGLVNERAKAVEAMAVQIETQLEELYRRAQGQLRFIIKNKLDVLLGDERELQRQVSEIQRHLDFTKYQQTGEATIFLFSYARQQRVREQLHSFAHFRDGVDVQLDAKVCGNLDVVTSGAAQSETSVPTISSRPLSVIKNNAATSAANLARAVSPLKSKSINSTLANSKAAVYASIGAGVPSTVHQARQRRTSDFFSETLTALDDFEITSIAAAHGECAESY